MNRRVILCSLLLSASLLPAASGALADSMALAPWPTPADLHRGSDVTRPTDDGIETPRERPGQTSGIVEDAIGQSEMTRRNAFFARETVGRGVGLILAVLLALAVGVTWFSQSRRFNLRGYADVGRRMMRNRHRRQARAATGARELARTRARPTDDQDQPPPERRAG